MPDRQGTVHQRRQRGVTLIEQVMVIAIMATLAGAALPSMRRLLGRNQLQAAQTDFIGALNHTRAAAVTGRRATVFCPSRDGQQCLDDERWDHGWLLAADGDHDNQPDAQPLYVNGSYADQLTIKSSSGRHHVRFQPDGSAGGSNLTFVFCHRGKAEQALSVVVANSGRLRGARASAEQAAACAKQE
ncbi:MAG: GspH/FimT family pseudopilin [Rhodanobacter sp.]